MADVTTKSESNSQQKILSQGRTLCDCYWLVATAGCLKTFVIFLFVSIQAGWLYLQLQALEEKVFDNGQWASAAGQPTSFKILIKM